MKTGAATAQSECTVQEPKANPSMDSPKQKEEEKHNQEPQRQHNEAPTEITAGNTRVQPEDKQSTDKAASSPARSSASQANSMPRLPERPRAARGSEHAATAKHGCFNATCNVSMN